MISAGLSWPLQPYQLPHCLRVHSSRNPSGPNGPTTNWIASAKSCRRVRTKPVSEQSSRKPCCFCHIQPKGQARHRKSLMHRYHHALMMSIIFHTMKTIGMRTSVLDFTANRNDGALRDVLVECLSPLPHSGVLQVNRLLALCPSSKHH